MHNTTSTVLYVSGNGYTFPNNVGKSLKVRRWRPHPKSQLGFKPISGWLKWYGRLWTTQYSSWHSIMQQACNVKLKNFLERRSSSLGLKVIFFLFQECFFLSIVIKYKLSYTSYLPRTRLIKQINEAFFIWCHIFPKKFP